MKKLFFYAAAALVAGGMLFYAQADAQMMHGSSGVSGQGMQKGMMGGATGGMHQGGMMGQSGMMGQGMHGGFGFYLNLSEQLNLTPAQIQKLQDLKFAFEKDGIQQRASVQTARLELQQLTASDKPDAGKVEAGIRNIYKQMADQQIAAFQARTRAQSVLTAEQLATAQKLAPSPTGGMMGPNGMMCGMMSGMMGPNGMMGQGMMGGTQGGPGGMHAQHHAN